jgi:hypothetical protein
MNSACEPLSESFETLLRANAEQRLTINELIRRTEGRGVYFVMILLCLPFISPIPVPGLSNIVGIIIVVFAAKLALKLPPSLPHILGEKEFSANRSEKILSWTEKILHGLEKIGRPRYVNLFSLSTIRWASALAFLLMGILLALPLPPIVPFSNSLPSWGIILLALASMERDGLVIWVGYAVSLGAFVYLALIAGGLLGSLERILRFF